MRFMLCRAGAAWGKWVSRALISAAAMAGLAVTAPAMAAQPARVQFVTEHTGVFGGRQTTFASRAASEGNIREVVFAPVAL